ncbi:MAG: hypothetical protein ACHQ52_04445 [Candidatus Eisenbacteria bacterium]
MTLERASPQPPRFRTCARFFPRTRDASHTLAPGGPVMKRLALLFSVLASLIALPALATVPSTMSYQGVLTDAGGNLVADGPYNLTFKIYTVPVAGAPIWTEVDPAVSVVKGGFSVVLGNVTSLSSLAFDVKYYLGITVGGGPELSPRVELAASPYGMSLRLPFAGSESSSNPVFSIHNGGAGAAITADPRLDVGSSTSDGTVNVYRNGSTNPVVSAYTSNAYGSGGQLDMRDENGTTEASLFPYGSDGYWLYVGGDAFGANGIAAIGNWDGANNPRLFTVGAYGVAFDASLAGDASVALPADAIDSGEILDEPGIAQGHTVSSVNVSNAGTMADIVTVTITTPSSGYIVVNASGQHRFDGDGANSNVAYFQIDETTGGGIDFSHYVVSGSYATSVNLQQSYEASFVTRTYFKPAGTYTFRWEAYAYNPASLTNYVYNPTITAQYYPTSYGSVTSGPSLTDNGRFSHVERSSLSANGAQLGGQAELVDLRELELKAAAQRAALAKTQEELARARFRQVVKANQAKPARKP